MKKEPIGADVIYSFEDEDERFEGYISFGEYEDGDRHDSFGILDDRILFYSSLDEIDTLGSAHGFVIHEWEPYFG